jgi:hypothetical protein
MTKKRILGCLRVPPVEYHWSRQTLSSHLVPQLSSGSGAITDRQTDRERDRRGKAISRNLATFRLNVATDFLRELDYDHGNWVEATQDQRLAFVVKVM